MRIAAKRSQDEDDAQGDRTIGFGNLSLLFLRTQNLRFFDLKYI